MPPLLQRLSGRPGQYLNESRRPLTSLVFVLPFLALYEGGVLLLGTAAVRNGADVWLRQLLDWLGLGGYFLLPVLTIAMLLGWHHTTRQPWRVSPGVLYGMFFESAVLGFVLMFLAHLQGVLLAVDGGGQQPDILFSIGQSMLEWLGRLVGFFGAGIYEEVLFRLLLVPLMAALIRLAGGSNRLCLVGSIIATSLLFSLAHYVGPHGETFQWYSFWFRFTAGGFFATLFVMRGFGIAVGCHALYDIFVGLF